jgi:hypothetical protein
VSNITGTVRALPSLPTNPTIYNVSVPTANTEVSQALSNGTKKFSIRCRGNAKIQLSFASGDSGTTYVTIPAGVTYTEDSVSFTGSLYFQTSLPSQMIEIVEWV